MTDREATMNAGHIIQNILEEDGITFVLECVADHCQSMADNAAEELKLLPEDQTPFYNNQKWITLTKQLEEPISTLTSMGIY